MCTLGNEMHTVELTVNAPNLTIALLAKHPGVVEAVQNHTRQLSTFSRKHHLVLLRGNVKLGSQVDCSRVKL